jgi:hypothetical protein
LAESVCAGVLQGFAFGNMDTVETVALVARLQNDLFCKAPGLIVLT